MRPNRNIKLRIIKSQDTSRRQQEQVPEGGWPLKRYKFATISLKNLAPEFAPKLILTRTLLQPPTASARVSKFVDISVKIMLIFWLLGLKSRKSLGQMGQQQKVNTKCEQ